MRWIQEWIVVGCALLTVSAATMAMEDGDISSSKHHTNAKLTRNMASHKQGREDGNQTINWNTRFTFEGQIHPGPYSVDPHIWVYTKNFADRFGMPSEWIDDGLNGVEAAAWRQTKTGYVTCGWAGKKDVCREEEGTVLELYFDTRKVTLPWAPWSEEFAHLTDRLWSTSSRFLTAQNCERRRDPTPAPLAPRSSSQENCIYNTYRTPFADPHTSEEVHFYEKGASYAGQGNSKGVSAYDKRVYPNLAWVQLGFIPTMVNMGRPQEAVVLTLEIRATPLGKTERLFHEVVLPEKFVRDVTAAYLAHRESTRGFYKKSLDMK